MEAAVVSSTEGVVRILLAKLGEFLSDKYVLLSGVRHEIQELKDDLESMNACLRDLAAVGDYHQSQQTRTWMKQVREVAYDAEDCIDSFRYHVGGDRNHDEGLLVVAGWLRRTALRPLTTLRAMYKLAVEVQSLKARALKVSERRLRYRLEPPAAASSSGEYAPRCYDDLDRRLPALSVDESRLVGVRSKTRAILKLLEHKDDGDDDGLARRKVVAVVGFGGLGKTTLAAMVYKSPAVQGIQHRAFVTVTRSCNLRAMLESLLEQLFAPARDPRCSRKEIMAMEKDEILRGIETKDIPQLLAHCSTHLSDKRYFIVVDDLWSLEDWASLKPAFPDNDKHSRIIITTRNRQVAESCCSLPGDRVHFMDVLPNDQSRELFFKTVFQKEHCPSEYRSLEGISGDILTKCGGLPLAIVSVGGMLAQAENKTPVERTKVCGKLGSGLSTSAAVRGMRRILSLSYHDLPYHLKACFLYLSVFREGYEIKRGPLVRRWAAEGFVGGGREWTPEEAAGKYIDEFVGRSIVTPTRVATNGVVRCCKVHDIMLEVMTAKCVEENFISLLGSVTSYGRHQHTAATTTGHDKIRRLSVHGSHMPQGQQSRSGGGDEDIFRFRRRRKKGEGEGQDDVLSSVDLSCARSLLMLRCIEKPLPSISFKRLKLLRVLDLEGCRWLSSRELDDICKLSLLRYLSLRDTGVQRLPRSVGRLKQLMTLDVRETDVRELPETITRLGHMRHLLSGSYSLRSLSILHWLNEDAGLEELLDLDSPPIFLEKFFLWGKLSMLPPWVSHLGNLVDLSLRENFLDGKEVIEQLGKLPSLLSLKLYYQSYMGRELHFREKLFPRLKQLIVDNMPNLDELSFQGGAPELERLTLAVLKEPADGISGIDKLPRLKEVEFFGHVIVDSVVESMVAVCKKHPNKPRVYRGDRPMEMDSELSS
uniref:NBS-LRR-like resistance protein n=1 Tax=Oryza sativa TaxID=4530 RepID=A0A0U2JFL8_ORYSA|nr:NBS-LRR-like resistance protein [Oryza sativa]